MAFGTPIILDVIDPSDLGKVVQEIMLSEARLVLLKGELGAGKTTLVKALCSHLGSSDEVSSPTFSLINEYRDLNGEPIYHIDLYRLDSLDEILQIGIEDYMLSGNWCIIEWPEQIEHLASLQASTNVEISVLPDGQRRICILK